MRSEQAMTRPALREEIADLVFDEINEGTGYLTLPQIREVSSLIADAILPILEREVKREREACAAHHDQMAQWCAEEWEGGARYPVKARWHAEQAAFLRARRPEVKE